MPEEVLQSTYSVNAQAMKTSLAHVVHALSDALDSVGIDDLSHGKRVGIMAAACGEALGMDVAECGFLIDLGLMHDIGVSSSETMAHLLQEFDWENSYEHANRGFELLINFPPLSRLANPIRYHHTPWSQLELLIGQNVTEQEAIEANLIFMVDRVDTFAIPWRRSGVLFEHTEEIRERIRSAAGTYFRPALVEAFLNISRREAFWLMTEPLALQRALAKHLELAEHRNLSHAQLLQLAKIFASIVDAKSRFTHEHSQGVTRLAVYIGRKLGLSDDACARLEIAGLLHDIGKLRIPDEILDKPGALTPQERHVMNTHSYETYQILSVIPGFDEIARIAAYHHEVPDGSGYPFHLTGAELSIEAQVLRVADIFQALGQNRPYRNGLAPEAIKKHLDSLVAEGKIDPVIVAAATQDLPAAIRAALDEG